MKEKLGIIFLLMTLFIIVHPLCCVIGILFFLSSLYAPLINRQFHLLFYNFYKTHYYFFGATEYSIKWHRRPCNRYFYWPLISSNTEKEEKGIFLANMLRNCIRIIISPYKIKSINIFHYKKVIG